MKIFISHQKADSELATRISYRLHSTHQIETYLDVIDPFASKTGDELGEYIRAQLSTCSQLLAVVSANTKGSWWVPWEIGVATEKDQPIATFAGDNTALPEYLRKWPYLSNQRELDEYARISKQAANTFRVRKGYLNEEVARRGSTSEYYRLLRGALGQ